MHPEGPATGHLDAGSLGFLCLSANAEVNKIYPLSVKATELLTELSKL
jgi:hypothetical protein